MCRDLFLHPLYHEGSQKSTDFWVTMVNLGLSNSFNYVLFSLCREKSTKRAPLKESTHGTFLKDPFPYSARLFRP